MIKPPALSARQMELIAKALAEPRRMEMLRKIAAMDGATPCSALQAESGISAATLSRHTKELENADWWKSAAKASSPISPSIARCWKPIWRI